MSVGVIIIFEKERELRNYQGQWSAALGIEFFAVGMFSLLNLGLTGGCVLAIGWGIRHEELSSLFMIPFALFFGACTIVAAVFAFKAMKQYNEEFKS